MMWLVTVKHAGNHARMLQRQDEHEEREDEREKFIPSRPAVLRAVLATNS